MGVGGVLILALPHYKEPRCFISKNASSGLLHGEDYKYKRRKVIKQLNEAAFLIQKFKEDKSMKDFWNVIQLVFSAVGGWLGYFLGGCDGLLYALIAFVVIDYITGVMCAIADKNLSSEVGFKGICRKVLIFLLVGIANILDVQVIQTGSVLRTAIIFFYISNEGVSLLENAAHLGLPVPEKIKVVLKQLHDKSEEE